MISFLVKPSGVNRLGVSSRRCLDWIELVFLFLEKTLWIFSTITSVGKVLLLKEFCFVGSALLMKAC